jgi:hypothetical protein
MLAVLATLLQRMTAKNSIARALPTVRRSLMTAVFAMATQITTIPYFLMEELANKIVLACGQALRRRTNAAFVTPIHLTTINVLQTAPVFPLATVTSTIVAGVTTSLLMTTQRVSRIAKELG